MLPAKCEGIEVQEGDLLYFDTWGGGGWGDPYQRSAELVLADVERGLVSEAGAERYGVVIVDGQYDADATADLREKLTAERGDLEKFNRGGTIEDLKTRCLAETGLEAPESPSFRQPA